MDSLDDRRRSLEEDAFGGTASEERRRAAVESLRRLDGEPRSAREASERGHRRRPSRGIVIAVGVAALVVGAVAGAAVDRGLVPRSATVGTTGSSTVLPGATAPAALAEAGLLLRQSRTSSDQLPVLVGSDRKIDASTSHLVTTSAQGERLFVARGSGGRAGYCLVTVSDDHSFGETSGYSQCVSEKTFARSGVSLSSAGYTAIWRGGTVTVTVRG